MMFGNDVKIGVLEQHVEELENKVEQLEKQVAEMQEVVGKFIAIWIAEKLESK